MLWTKVPYFEQRRRRAQNHVYHLQLNSDVWDVCSYVDAFLRPCRLSQACQLGTMPPPQLHRVVVTCMTIFLRCIFAVLPGQGNYLIEYIPEWRPSRKRVGIRDEWVLFRKGGGGDCKNHSYVSSCDQTSDGTTAWSRFWNRAMFLRLRAQSAMVRMCRALERDGLAEVGSPWAAGACNGDTFLARRHVLIQNTSARHFPS